MRHTTTLSAAMAASMLILGLGASRARADDGGVELELTIPVALADRSTTGTAPAGWGYDDQTGLLAGAEARLYLAGPNRYFQWGAMIGGQHMAGPFMGLGGHAFRSTYMDAGLTARALLPCMSGGDTRWHVGGVLALTGVHADAGLGVGGSDNGPDFEARRAAADTLDHAGLGWRLAFDLSMHQGNFIGGIGVGVRQYFGIDSPVARGWVMDIGLRLGARIDLFGGESPRYDEPV